jgi:uncharacterized protein YkwD
MRRKLTLLVVAAVLAVPVPAAGLQPPERTALRLVNDTRDRKDLRILDARRRLSRYAERHAHRMANQRRLFHSSLRISGYDSLGEIVASASSVRAAHRAFLRSSPHRRVMLGRWRMIGLGVARRGDDVYVVEIYAR